MTDRRAGLGGSSQRRRVGRAPRGFALVAVAALAAIGVAAYLVTDGSLPAVVGAAAVGAVLGIYGGRAVLERDARGRP